MKMEASRETSTSFDLRVKLEICFTWDLASRELIVEPRLEEDVNLSLQ